MINKTTTLKTRPAHCGYEAEPPFPVKPLPNGTTLKKNPDGTVTIIYPAKEEKE